MPLSRRSPRRRDSRRSRSRSRSLFRERQRFRPQSLPGFRNKNYHNQRSRLERNQPQSARPRTKRLESREQFSRRKSSSPRRRYEATKYRQHENRNLQPERGRYRSPRREGFRDEQEVFQSPDQFTSNLPKHDTSPVDTRRESSGNRVTPHFPESAPYTDNILLPMKQNRQTVSDHFYSTDRLQISNLSRTRSPSSLSGHVVVEENQPQSSFVSQEVSSSTGDKYGTRMLKVVSTLQRKQTLNERFRSDDQIGEMATKFEDNITIGIHRHPNASSVSPGPINRTFDPSNSVIYISRRREEGKKAIFDREEIKQFRHDSKYGEFSGYEERRVIAVIPAKRQYIDDDRSLFHVKETFPAAQQQKHENERQRNVIEDERSEHKRYDYEHSGHRKHSKDRKDIQQHQWHEQQIRVVAKPDPRYEPLYKEEKEREERIHFREQERMERVQHDPSDLRHNLLKHHSAEGDRPQSQDVRRRIDRRHEDERRTGTMDARNRQTESRRLNSSASRSSDDRGREKPRSAGATDLPDFSRRQDKYGYEVWKDKPELIPKNPSYFEHDNRDDILDDNRGQLRSGGFRGRADFRGRYSSRGFRGRFSSSRFRGRGRGFTDFGRGRSRGGNYRRDLPSSTPSYSSRSGDRERDRERDRDRDRERDRDRGRERNKDEWKHDMFEEMEQEDDNKPTSTT